MFRKRREDELWKLQQELLAAEEDEYEEYDEDEPEYDDSEELTDEEDYDEEDTDDDFDPDEDDDYEEEPACSGPMTRYGRKSQMRFSQNDLFDDEGFEDGDVLYRRDYRKAKRKKRRKKMGLLILAILEVMAIIALILWFTSWTQ